MATVMLSFLAGLFVGEEAYELDFLHSSRSSHKRERGHLGARADRMGLPRPSIPTGRPEMPPSELILSVLTPFRTAFTRPTWEKVLVLVTGTILARGEHVAAALRTAGHEQDPRFSRFHAVFSRDRWSALEPARRRPPADPGLRPEQGGALRALASRDDHFTRIARVLRYIHSEYAKPLGVEEMARRAGMSVSVFHHHFKLVTACSPLQYLKRIRLDRARTLMALDGYNAGTAARAVGYESASQFGREFKRLFGVTPVEEAEQTRARLVAV